MVHEVSKCQNFLQEKWNDITNHKDFSNTRSNDEEILEQQSEMSIESQIKQN